MNESYSKFTAPPIVVILLYAFSPIITGFLLTLFSDQFSFVAPGHSILEILIKSMLLSLIFACVPATITGILTSIFKKICLRYWILISILAGFFSSFLWVLWVDEFHYQSGMLSFAILGAITAFIVSLLVILFEKG
ncbi:hypothetical protein GKC56_07345 [Neisseriaceae bacterium PsAf]|nr:hypothetical protein [Neisseriaceae bacterium PsAf]